MNFVASDGVVSLRALELADAAVHLAGEDAALVTWLNEGHSSTPESVRAWIASSVAAGVESKRRELAIVVDGALVGVATIDGDLAGLGPDEVNIAYGIYPAHRGHGHATRAVRLSCELAASMFAAKVAVLQIHPENEASVAVASRLGFAASGTTPDGLMRHVAPVTDVAARSVSSKRSQPVSGPVHAIVNRMADVTSPSKFEAFALGPPYSRPDPE